MAEELRLPMLSLSFDEPDEPAEEAVSSIQEQLPAEKQAETPAEAPAQPVKPRLPKDALTPEELAAVTAFVEKIDVTNSDQVLTYGADAQKNISAFSDQTLQAVRAQDSGEIGDMLVNMTTELKGFAADSEEPKGIFKLFRKGEDSITRMKARYDTVSANVENIAASLENYKAKLLKDIKMYDKMYDQNSAYFRHLTLYIIAGQAKLDQVREGELKELQDKAAASGDAMDAQKANDLAAKCDRFEKKLHDLLLSRQVALQTAPQIRLLQNNDTVLVERISSTIVNTLPLWKSQMVMALGIHNSKQALKAQKAVTDMTNDLLKKNAAMLKQGTIEVAREAERGIIDIETLQATNRDLIDSLTEVVKIQQEGRAKRLEAERTMMKMEAELKQKLLNTNLN